MSEELIKPKNKGGRPRIASPEAMAAIDRLYEGDNPDSLVNRLPHRLVPIFERVRQKLPRTLLAEEPDVRRYCTPNERDDRVRLSFWDEYNASTSIGKRMSLASIITGCVSWESWVTTYEPNDKRMLWIFTPPASYVHLMRQILHRGTERLLEIMNLPMINDEGKVDAKVANLVLRAWQLADMRVKGAVTQKVQIEQKSMNLNLNTTDNAVHQLRQQVSGMGLEDLEALEKRIEKAKRDQSKLLKHADPEQIDLIVNGPGRGDFTMLEDMELMTSAQRRHDLPPLEPLPRVTPELGKVPTNGEETDEE